MLYEAVKQRHEQKIRDLEEQAKNNNIDTFPYVSIITPTNREYCMEMLFENYQRQKYPNKELIIILNNDQMSLLKWKQKAKDYENVRVF